MSFHLFFDVGSFCISFILFCWWQMQNSWSELGKSVTRVVRHFSSLQIIIVCIEFTNSSSSYALHFRQHYTRIFIMILHIKCQTTEANLHNHRHRSRRSDSSDIFTIDCLYKICRFLSHHLWACCMQNCRVATIRTQYEIPQHRQTMEMWDINYGKLHIANYLSTSIARECLRMLKVLYHDFIW